MKRHGGLRPTHAAYIKRFLILVVVAILGYVGYKVALARRPPLPERSAEWVAQDYLMALHNQDYATAYTLVCKAAQDGTTPLQMQDVGKEVLISIDNWVLGQAKYAPTHLSATVPVTLYYHAGFAPDDQRRLEGWINVKLESGSWKLVAAMPFVTAIMKQRDQQHLAGVK